MLEKFSCVCYRLRTIVGKLSTSLFHSWNSEVLWLALKAFELQRTQNNMWSKFFDGALGLDKPLYFLPMHITITLCLLAKDVVPPWCYVHGQCEAWLGGGVRSRRHQRAPQGRRPRRQSRIHLRRSPPAPLNFPQTFCGGHSGTPKQRPQCARRTQWPSIAPRSINKSFRL